jgi:hypothetical protein
MPTRHSLFAIGLAFLIFAFPPLVRITHAQPVSDWQPSEAELQQIPKYCMGQFRKEFQQKPGYSIYTIKSCGDHFNHFCPALVGLSRAANFTAPKKERKYYLGTAGSHLRYTRKFLPPTCELEADIKAAEMRHRMLSTMLK